MAGSVTVTSTNHPPAADPFPIRGRTGPGIEGEAREKSVAHVLRYLPRGNLLDDSAWRQRHRINQWLLFVHLPALAVFGIAVGRAPGVVGLTVLPVVAFLLIGSYVHGRRLASTFISLGLVWCSVALVGLSGGVIEAHFHFFFIIPFIALYQDWIPFLVEIVATVLSHGAGAAFFGHHLMFNSMSGMEHPWVWAGIHGFAVAATCVGMTIYWRVSEDEQEKTLALSRRLDEAELARQTFTHELLVNLARRNQSMLYRQLRILNQLEENERDPDALAELFRLDHLATRIRRNAESLLVLSGEESPRAWRRPVRLVDVVRAAIAETEDLDRVLFSVDERLDVVGRSVTDLTHLLAELIENAVRSSPPEAPVTIRSMPDVRVPRSVVLTIEDWGVGMPPGDLALANQTLAESSDVDVMISRRLGLHVVARLARRYGIEVLLTTTSGPGITAVVQLPPDLFAEQVPPASVTPEPESTPLPTRPGHGPSGPPSPPLGSAMLAGPTPPAGLNLRPGGAATRAPGARRPLAPASPPGARTPSPQTWPPQGLPVSRVAAAPHEQVPAAPTVPTGSAASTAGVVSAGGLQLNRRVPQAHLAPELRREGAPEPVPSEDERAQIPDAARAREALSRYQSSRQAALDRTKSDGGQR
jgi:signal transduction histidine kinase